MRKIYKKQFGGFGIDPSLGGLLNGIDLNNLDFNQVAQLGSQIGGDPFDQAMLQDDPTLYTNSMIGSASRDFATANNPLRTQAEIGEEAKKRTFLGIGKRRATRKLEQENQDRFDLNENTAGNNAQDTLTQFGNLQGLFNLIGNFQKGGNMRKLQTGGKVQFIKDTDGIVAKIKALPDTKEGRLAISGILASHMGVEIDLKPDSPNWVKRFKEEYEVDVDDKGKGTNKLTPAFLNKMADEFRRFSLKSEGVMMEFQDGGKAGLGYSDNSPYRNESQITIPGNNITMANTGQPLMAYPNIGSPKLLKPYSGTHLFPDATSVTEIPLMKKGGKKKKKKMRYYQDGGSPIPAGVQLEEEEMILTPNMDILDTAARESHKKMDKDEVTDIIRPEDYVLSDKLKITKKEAENMSLGYGAMLYKEGKIPKMPEEHTIASFFKEGEKEMTLAEYGKRIRKKLPITDKKDVFSLKTNDANRAARLPYIASAVYINEKKRTKGKPEASFASTFENKFEGTFGSQSGRTEQGRAVMALPGEPQEMQGGGPLEGLNPIGTAFTIGTGLYDMFIGAPKRKRIALAALDQDNKDINTLAGSQSGFSNAATVAALAGYSFQDPTVNAPQYDSTQLDQRVRRVPKTLFDYASGRAMAGFRSAQDSIFKNAGSFSQAVNAISPMYASNVGMTANLGMQEVQQNIGLENQYRDLKQTFNDRQTTVDNTARNATRTNTNALVAGTAGTLSGGISTQGNIEANRQNALRSNKMQGAQAKINANQQGVQSAYNIGTMAMMLPNNMFNQPQGVNNNLPYIAPPQPFNAPTQLNQPTPFGLNPITPTIPYGTGVPTNQQGSTVPLGPNSVFDPATGLWYG